MPIDASIFSQVQQPRMPAPPMNPLAALGQAYQIKALQSQTQKADFDMGQQNKLLALVGQPTFTSATPIEQARQLQGIGAFEPAGKVITSNAAAAKDTREAEGFALKNNAAKVQLVGQVLAGVRDQSSYERGIQTLNGMGIPTPNAPPQYDPTVVEQFARQALTPKEQLPTLQTNNVGGSTVTQALDPLTGRPISQSAIQNTQSPDNAASVSATMRGQNLLDARSRESNDIQRSAARTQVLETPDGVMLVDKGTGQARPATAADGLPLPGKPSESTKKELMSISQQRSIINGAMQAVEKTPGAFSFTRGAVSGITGGESIAGRFETDEETQARAYVYNNVSRVINERAGAAQSAQELARLNGFLPAATDTSTQIANKLKAFNHYLDDLEAGTRNVRTTSEPRGSQVITVRNADDYSRVPSGATYIAPDGKTRRKQ